MFPLKLIDSKNWMKLKKVRIDENEVLESKKNITKFTGKPVYLLDLKSDMDKLIEDILEFFSEN